MGFTTGLSGSLSEDLCGVQCGLKEGHKGGVHKRLKEELAEGGAYVGFNVDLGGAKRGDLRRDVHGL